MRKYIYLMLAFLTLEIASVKAQVTIGSLEEAHKGAVLDLSKTKNKELGVLLPHVELTSIHLWKPLRGDSISGDGMLVYNTSASVLNGLEGEGVYVWSEGKWMAIFGDEPCETPGKPGVISFSKTNLSENDSIIATVVDNSAPYYIWELPSGLYGYSLTNRIAIKGRAGSYSLSGIKVRAVNRCGMSEARSGDEENANITISITPDSFGSSGCPGYLVQEGVYTQKSPGYIADLTYDGNVFQYFDRVTDASLCIYWLDGWFAQPWSTGRDMCADGSFTPGEPANSGWRLPNVAELVNLGSSFKYYGMTGSTHTLQPSYTAYRYWSSTEQSSTKVYFGLASDRENVSMNFGPSPTNKEENWNIAVRCVKTISQQTGATDNF